MNSKFYTAVLLLLPFFSIAQSNYKSGYVINTKGDTLRGYIDYKEWSRNPQNINFKSTLNEKAQRLGLNDINCFQVEGAASYREYRVNISLNSVDISSPASLRDTSSTVDNVFLKILQRGRYLTLYSYNDAVKNRFYIKDNSDKAPVELIYGVYENPGNSIGTLEINTYRDQLNQLAVKYMGGLDIPTDQIQGARYNESSLLPIVAKINGEDFTKMSTTLGSAQVKHPGIRFFVGGAYNESTFKYTPRGIPYPGSVPSSSGSPKLTFGLDALVNPDIGHLVFRLELAYQQQSSYHFQEADIPANFSDDEIDSQTLKQTNFSIVPQVIYNLYNANSVKVFVDFGLAFMISSYVNQVTSKGLFSTTTTSGPAPGYHSTWFSVQLKGGVVVSKKIEIYGAYYPAVTLAEGVDSDFVGYSGILSSYQIGLNYFFK